MAKRRRMNGSLEEAVPLGDAASLGFDGAAEVPVASPADGPAGPERTEILDERASELPAAHSNATVPNELSGRPEPSAWKTPPEAIPIGNASLAAPEAVRVTPLEMRIRRLEDALAQLQEMRTAEVRITTSQPARPAIPVATAAPVPRAPTDRLWELGKRVLTSPGEVARSLSTPPGPIGSRAGWLVVESVAEARAIFRMFTDPRYRLSWTGRIVPLVLTVLIVGSWWWVPFTSVPVFGTLLNKSIDLVLAFVLFKQLGHEARRYRETAPDLPPSLRL